jgi:hypothetical protein
MLEGLICGFAGSLLAVVLLILGKRRDALEGGEREQRESGDEHPVLRKVREAFVPAPVPQRIP